MEERRYLEAAEAPGTSFEKLKERCNDVQVYLTTISYHDSTVQVVCNTFKVLFACRRGDLVSFVTEPNSDTLARGRRNFFAAGSCSTHIDHTKTQGVCGHLRVKT